MPDALVTLAVDRGVATITLDSPHNRNALSRQLRAELASALATARADAGVRVVVLTHSGPVFCAGMDLKEARGADASDQGARGLPEILEALLTSPQPVVARLAGPARAGGLGVVAACDIAITADDATFAFSEVRIGVVPALISAVVLPRVLPAAAHELFLTGETFDAHRAADIGLVTKAVPVGDVDEEVRRYTAMLTLGAPGALAVTKELLLGAWRGDSGAELARLAAVSARHFASAEGQEGVQAFAEKRPPAWVPPPS